MELMLSYFSHESQGLKSNVKHEVNPWGISVVDEGMLALDINLIS